MIWQAAALAFYILSALFVDSFVIIFVITVLLAALDFWVVKNVSGRILVGLRWWNEINDEGESVWTFESLDKEVADSLIYSYIHFLYNIITFSLRIFSRYLDPVLLNLSLIVYHNPFC